MDRNDARAALDAVKNTDRRMAERMQWPLWRHAAFGAVEAIFLLGLALPPAAMAACLVFATAGIAIIVRDDRKRHGMFVSGYSSKAAIPAVFLAFAIFAAGLVAIVFTGGINQWSDWVPLILIIVFVGETLASLWWQSLAQADLQTVGRGE